MANNFFLKFTEDFVKCFNYRNERKIYEFSYRGTPD